MSTVFSLTSREPFPARGLERDPAVGGTGAPPSPAAAARTSAVSPTSSRPVVEEYRENDRNQGVVGKAFESYYEKALRGIPPGGKVDIALLAQVRLELAGEVKARAEVERLPDGSYQLTLRGGVGVGLAGSTGGEGGARGSAMVGAQGAVTLRFSNAAEAADRLAALAQAEMLTASGFAGRVAVWLGILDSDAIDRSSQVLKNVRSFEAGLYAELRGELELTAARLEGAIVGEGTFRVDVANGKLVYESSVQVQLQAESEGLTFRGMKQEPLNAGTGGEGRFLLKAEVTLTKEEMVRLGEGRLRPRELMKPERIQKSLTQELKGELSAIKGGLGVSYTARRELPLASLGELRRALDLRGEWEVSAMRKQGVLWDEDEMKIDAAVARLKASVSVEVPLLGPRKMMLGDIAGAVRQAQSEAKSHEQLLLARRAMGR